MVKWLKNSVFYEVYPQSFCDSNGDGIGDINGVLQKLDYIKSLGCNAIWLNPCFDSPFMDGGYDVRDYYKVAKRYGTNEDLENLFKEAHKRDMHIILDLVPGHTSDRNEWFLKSRLPEQNEYSNRYIWTDSVWEAPPQYKLICGVTDRDANYMVNFFSSQPALNYGFAKITHPWQLPCDHPDCQKTVEALKDIMRFWLDKGCDGFRVDMADSLVKNEDDKVETAKIWRGIRQMLDEEYPQAVLVSEWCNPYMAINKGGFHCDFYLDHYKNGYNTLFRFFDRDKNQDRSFFKGSGDITLFTDEYTDNYEKTKKNGYISFITCNHDTPRMSKTLTTQELKLAYCTVFTLPGVPFLYYGDEIGMRYIEGLKSKEGAFSRTGTRTPMQWSNGKNKGFSSADEEALYLPVDSAPDAPTVEAQLNDKDSLLNVVKDIIRIRKENEDLGSDGDFSVVYAKKNEYPFVYKRGAFVVAVNPSASPINIPIEYEVSKTVYKIGESSVQNGRLTMNDESFAIFEI